MRLINIYVAEKILYIPMVAHREKVDGFIIIVCLFGIFSDIYNNVTDSLP